MVYGVTLCRGCDRSDIFDADIEPVRGAPNMSSDSGVLNASSVWQKHFSTKHNCDYWFNLTNGDRTWTEPEIVTDSLSKKRSIDSDIAPVDSHKIQPEISSAAPSNGPKFENLPVKKSCNASIKMSPEIAIIVPYRDLHKEQSRKQQLDLFIPSISKFMEKNKERSSYRIYIIEQSNDERKFNRGKLLNIGFEIACSDGCKSFVFHDVDLLPSPELHEFYYKIPEEKPIHIARVWDRYSVNEGYFGGITSFSEDQFRKINGFPNNFWGWGGEDDELYKRTRVVGMSATFPTIGKITDMENFTLKNKLQFLREHKVWKCMNKVEVLAEHSSSWRTNGLFSLNYKELSRTDISPTAVVIRVDVCLNSHWTDLVCGVNDTQLTETVEAVQARFSGLKSSQNNKA